MYQEILNNLYFTVPFEINSTKNTDHEKVFSVVSILNFGEMFLLNI